MKVTIAGQVYDYDGTKAPMSEALWIEHVYKRRFAEWQDDLQAGSAKAMCMLACVILRRNGRDEPTFEDLTGGTADFDLMEMLSSLAEAAEEAQREAADPTPAGPDPAGTRSTGTGTSAPSRKGSGSGRGK